MRKFFSNHEETMMKILSVIIAILLWSYVMSEVDPETQRTYYDIPVQVEGMNRLKENGYQLLNFSDETVDVTVAGKRKFINRLDKNDIIATCDIGNLSEGEHTRRVSINISNPDVRVVESNPRDVSFSIDEVISRTFPIEVKTLGDLPEDFILNDVSLVTKEVQVKGPRKLIDKITAAITYVKLADRKEPVIVNSKIILLDENDNQIDDLDLEPASTEVNLSISKVKSVPIEVNFTDTLPDGFNKEQITVTPNTVAISGDRRTLNQVESIGTAPVSAEQLMNQETIKLTLQVPEGVKIIKPEESYLVRYSTTSPVQETRKVDAKNIKITNLEEDLQYTLEDVVIDVVVEGDANLLSALNEEDISLYIDGKTLTDGNNMAMIEAKVPSGIEVKRINPDKIKIDLANEDTP